MEHLISDAGIRISYTKAGSGPALVLVHGGFSDHDTNWEFVMPRWRERFTMYAIARRGRGETDAARGQSLHDEALDVVALIEKIGEPVYLLGHSYGAQCALSAAMTVPGRIRKLVLYEAPHPEIFTPGFAPLEALAARDAWDEFAFSFFRDSLRVPVAELEALRATELWPPIVADGKATLGDLRALARHTVDYGRARVLEMPVMLQIGTESPRGLYITDALAAVLPDGHVAELAGQAHEGMTTAPVMYAEAVTQFLLGAADAEQAFEQDAQWVSA